MGGELDILAAIEPMTCTDFFGERTVNSVSQ
jgi:hypothetical protein